MKVLVTGGTGVNGAALARLLVSEGIRPVLFDNRMDLSLVGDLKEKVDLVEGDVVDPRSLANAVTGHQINRIAHLAALMPKPAEADPAVAVRVGIEGTVNVLEVARAQKVQRVLYTSSKAVYGEVLGEFGEPRFIPVPEDHPRNPADLYGVIKVSCEELGKYYREAYGVDFIALRFSSIYGPGKETRHGPLSFYGRLIEATKAGVEWKIPAGGDQLNDAVYVGDVARSIYLALKAERSNQWVFNIGTGRGSTPRQFLSALEKLFPEHRIDLGPGQSNLGREKRSFCIFDISAARQHLGYEPIYDVERGVRDYVDTLSRLGR